MFEQLGVQTNIPLAPFTTFKIGGPAEYLLRAKSIEAIQAAVQVAKANQLPVTVLGGGSNVLVHDHGVKGLVIKNELAGITVEGDMLTAGAGLPLSAVIRSAIGKGLAGLEFATGVPASVGGAIWANLGCRGSEMSQVVHSVTVLDADGTVKMLSNAECQYGYRDSAFKRSPMIILQAVFKLNSGDPTALRQRMMELTKLKKEEQNVGEDTAGCTFRNPAPTSNGAPKAASQYIDELGLKGYRIGDAMVSTTHANFILNVGKATADQVVQLVSYIKQQVRDKAGVQLQEEIEYIGF